MARIKANKFAEMYAVGQYDGMPPHIFVNDRLKVTTHGHLFHSLLLAIAPASVALVAKGEITADDVVSYARDLAEGAYRITSGNPMMGMSVPPKSSVEKNLKGGQNE